MSATASKVKANAGPIGIAHWIQTKSDDPYAGVPSKDERGHGNTVGSRVSTHVKRQIDELMSQNGPGTRRGWLTESDFVRWCYKLGLDVVAEEEKRGGNGNGKFMSLHSMNNAIDKVLRTEEHFAEFDKVFADAEKLMQNLVARGQTKRIKVVLFEIYQQIRRLDNLDWLKYYNSEMEKRFGTMMKRHKISFKVKDFESDEVEDLYSRS